MFKIVNYMNNKSKVKTLADSIKTKYPDIYKSILDLVKIDTLIKKIIDKKYGENTLENIIKTTEFNKALEFCELGIYTDCFIGTLAKRRHDIYETYVDNTFKLSQIFGTKDALKLIDILKEYMENQIN